MNKTTKVREYLKANPTHSPLQVAEATGASRALVYLVQAHKGGTNSRANSTPQAKRAKPSSVHARVERYRELVREVTGEDIGYPRALDSLVNRGLAAAARALEA